MGRVTGEGFRICPTCLKAVDPADESTLYAVQLERSDRVGGVDYVEGMGEYFHSGCFYFVCGYRRKPKPAPPAA